MYAHMYVGASELANVRVLMTTIKVLNGEKKNIDSLLKPDERKLGCSD